MFRMSKKLKSRWFIQQRNTRNWKCCNKPKDFNEFQKQIKAAQDISEDYEYIKSGRALDDKDKEIREKDDLLNKAVERIENADDNFNQLYENAKP